MSPRRAGDSRWTCCSMQTQLQGQPPKLSQAQKGNLNLKATLCCPENWAAGLVGEGGASLVRDPGVESGASFTLPTRSQAAAPFHIREEELG